MESAVIRIPLILAGFIILSLVACSQPTSGSGGAGSGGNTTSNPQNEGSITSPILLTIGTPRVCKIGKSSDSATRSYYKVVIPPSQNTCTITATSFSPASVNKISVSAYSSSDFTSFIFSSLYVNPYATFFTASTGETWYIILDNTDNSALNISYTVTITTT